MIFISDIADALKEGKTDQETNTLIQELIGSEEGVNTWRITNYSELRRWAYPNITEYLDAQVKLATPDVAIQSEGQIQLDQYYQKCMAVKIRFPKE